MKRSCPALIITPLTIVATLGLSACQGLNQKIGRFDAAADKAVVDNVDNSRINQSINGGLNKAGEAVTSILPGMMRPPPERLATNESVAAGESPDPAPTDAQPGSVQAQQPVRMLPPPVQAAVVAAPPPTMQTPEGPVDLTEIHAAGVTLKRSNIRMGPGLDHDIIDTVAAGTPLTISGRTPDGWLLVDRGGMAFGFVFARLVRLAD